MALAVGRREEVEKKVENKTSYEETSIEVSNSIGEVGGMFGPETEAVDRLDPPYYGVS